MMFSTAPDYVGDTVSVTVDGFTLTATMHRDDDTGAPWKEHDGHGPVSEWERRGEAPGELVLAGDCRGRLGTDERRRFYDFAEACRIARRDGWGVAPYRVDRECTVNGIWTVTAQWLEGRDCVSFRSVGDDVNAAIREVYDQHRATMSPRAYAAAAARQDFERLRAWCNDEWHWCGIEVTASREDVELGSASLWGIESDAGSYLVEVANELAAEAIENAREKLAALCC